jgi:GNAT superfamily N-acetyltransferase
MPIQELTLQGLDAVWPQLRHLLDDNDSAGKLERVRSMLASDGPYCLLAADDDGAATGLALVEHYRNAWVFEYNVAAIREFIATDSARAALLSAIEVQARGDRLDYVSRFTGADDPLLPWWYEMGFVEYMAAFRRALDAEGEAAARTADDGIVIRKITDLPADWPKLWPLLEKLNQHHAPLVGRPLLANREEETRRSLERELRDGEAMVMLAEADGAAVATSSAELGEIHPDGSRLGHRSRLYVEEPYRGRGLSARFEALALPWFRERGVTDVERWIVAGNERPRQIWSARGYRPERLLLRKALQP